MILGNYSILNRNAMTMVGNQFTNPMAMFKATAMHRFYQGEHVVTGETDKASFNNGYSHPVAWWMAPVAGGIGSIGRAIGTGSSGMSIAGGRNGDAALAGTGDLTVTGQLVVSAVAAIAGSGALSGGLLASLAAVAALAGSGDVAGAMTALGALILSVSGTGALTTTIRASGELGADIQPYTELSPESLATAVWSSAQGAFLAAVARNKVITDPSAGTMTVYDTDGTTVLYVADLFQDSAGAVPYAGAGAERRDRFE